jgi:hypothetical protein
MWHDSPKGALQPTGFIEDPIAWIADMDFMYSTAFVLELIT